MIQMHLTHSYTVEINLMSSSPLQPMPGQHQRKTNLILTGAWNPIIVQPPSILEDRRRRLVSSLQYYADSRLFTNIYLLDSTIDIASAASLKKISPDIISIPNIVTQPDGEFLGPSYLEALLYISANKQQRNSGHQNTHTFKITGGYIVQNIAAIVKRYNDERLDAMGFLQQNPLRLNSRYVMTSCMAMSNQNWQGLITELQLKLERLRTIPLEAVFCQFLGTLRSARGLSMPYPRLEARFGTFGKTSASFSYRFREAIWRLYSCAGFYVLTHREDV